MQWSGVVALVLASLLWGTTGTTASFLPDDVSPLAIGASTMGIGGALLFLVSARGAIGVLRDRTARRWVALGAVGVFVYPLAFYAGMDLAGVAVGNVVALGSGPVFAALLEWLWERRPLSARWAVSTGLAVLGIALLGFGKQVDAGAGPLDTVAGVGLGLLAGLAYALYTYASSRAIGRGQPSRGVMGAMFGLGAVLLLPVLLLTGAPAPAVLEHGRDRGVSRDRADVRGLPAVRCRPAQHPELVGDDDHAARTRRRHGARRSGRRGAPCARRMGRTGPGSRWIDRARYGPARAENGRTTLESGE